MDVSDGGLSFHAVAPVEPATTIHFLLSLRGHSRIEGAGEVVWTNQMRTVCGLKFTSLPNGAREYLNDWTNRSRSPAPARERNIFAQTAQPISPAPDSRLLAANTIPVFAIPPTAESPLSIPESSTPWQERFSSWTMFWFMVVTLAVAMFFYGLHVGRSESESASQPAASPAALPESQPAPPTLAPAPVPTSSDAAGDASSPRGALSVPSGAAPVPRAAAPVPNAAIVNSSKTDDTYRSTAEPPGAGAIAAAPGQNAEQKLQAGQSELAAAQAYLTGIHRGRDSSTAARLLWAAVGNGNVTAEVVLADLYLHGDGVAKSCEQGRILLIGASKSGNAEAREKLKELNANGCR